MKPKNKPALFQDLDVFLRWKEEWIDMPEFIQEDLSPLSSVKVLFKSKEDRDAFAKLAEQKITDKTISLWYPKSEKENLLTKKCIDEKR